MPSGITQIKTITKVSSEVKFKTQTGSKVMLSTKIIKTMQPSKQAYQTNPMKQTLDQQMIQDNYGVGPSKRLKKDFSQQNVISSRAKSNSRARSASS